MNKTFYIALLIVFTASMSFAQRIAKEKKYDKIVYNTVTHESGNLTIYAVDAVSTEAYFKFKLRIQNKSADYVVVDLTKLKVILPDGKEFKATEKSLAIAPGEFANRVIDIKGPDFRVTSLKINLEGITSAPVNGKVYEAPIYKLPVSTNDFTVGPFKVVQKLNEIKTDITLVKFEVTYTGNDIGVLQPHKTVLKMPSGNEFATMSSNRKAVLLGPGDSDVFNVRWEEIDVKQNGDMQKVQMQLLFKDAFMESKASALPATSFDLTINEKESD